MKLDNKMEKEYKPLTSIKIEPKTAKMNVLPKISESKLQQQCVRWFRMQYKNHLLFAIPNGGKRNIVTATIQKAEGVLPGVADIQILTKSGKSLFIEMKLPKTKQTDNQKEFEAFCDRNGYYYFVCRSLTEFQETVNNYLKS